MNKIANRELLASLLLFLVAAIWGSGFIASQMALDAAVSPELLMFVRFTVAALIVLVFCGKHLRKHLKKEHLRDGVTIGVFLFLGFYLQIVALQYTSPSNNAFITATNVVMVPFIWWAFSKKRPENRVFVTSLLCLVGIGILSTNVTTGLSFSPGDLLTLLCAFFFACQIAATGKLAERMDTVVLVFLQFAVASVLSFAVFLFTDRDISGLGSVGGFGSVLYLGIFSTCLCFFLQTAAQKHVSSSKAAVILAGESLFGTLFSLIIGYERLTLPMAVGGAVIIASLVLTELKPRPGAAAKAQLATEGAE